MKNKSVSPVLGLTRQLINCASVTPDDGGVLDILSARLAAQNFSLEQFDHNGVKNLWARRGIASPLFCFAGHCDVVPPGPLQEWHSPPFVASIRDEKLYGRGAVDMKSSLAAFIIAIENTLAAHPSLPGSLALLITSDEEGPAVDGTAYVVKKLQARNEQIDFCIVGEPSCAKQLGDTVKFGRRGSLSLRLTIIGLQGHIAYPERAKNAIHLALPALAELAAQAKWDDGNKDFSPTGFQISNIRAGTGAGNVVPGELVVDANFRFSTASTIATLQSHVHEVLDRHQLCYNIEWTIGALPFLTLHGRLIDAARAVITELTGITPELSTSGGTSDGRFIAAMCKDVIEFGPCNHSIHGLNEHIPLADLEMLPLIYQRLIERMLGATSTTALG